MTLFNSVEKYLKKGGQFVRFMHPNVREATIQNIMMSLGLTVVKDDVHVTNARRRLRIPPEIKSHELATLLGYDPIVLDKILFEWDRNYPE